MNESEVVFCINEETGEISLLVKNATEEEAKVIVAQVQEAIEVNNCPLVFSELISNE